MSAITIATIRQRIATPLEALAAPAWTESHVAFDVFPQQLLTDRAHLSFAVGCPSSRFVSSEESSTVRRGAAGGLVITVWSVRYLYLLRSDSSRDDADLATAQEARAIAAILGIAMTDLSDLYVEDALRSAFADASGNEWFLGELTGRVRHHLAIQ